MESVPIRDVRDALACRDVKKLTLAGLTHDKLKHIGHPESVLTSIEEPIYQCVDMYSRSIHQDGAFMSV